MRSVPPAWAAYLANSHTACSRVTSYYAGKLTAVVPITDGELTFDDTATLRRRCAITVPAQTPDGVTWDPGTSTTAPLAAYGQRLKVETGILLGATPLLLSQGWYLISGWERDESGGSIDVTAVDLAQLIADARMLKPQSPPRGATYRSEFVRLVAGAALTADTTAAPADQPISTSIVWDRDRDAALNTLCAAWGARWYVNDTGQVAAAPAYPAVSASTPPVVTVIDGTQGTVTRRTRSGGRARLYNAVVVTGRQPDDQTKAAPYAVAQITTGPLATTGPYGSVPRFYQSDLITTTAQAQATANNMLTSAAKLGRDESVDAVPNAAIELGDVARVVTSGNAFTGRVTAITLPLLATGGPMALSVSTEPADDEGN